jgi:hypothetical protein
MFVAIIEKSTFILHFMEENNTIPEENEKAKRIITF